MVCRLAGSGRAGVWSWRGRNRAGRGPQARGRFCGGAGSVWARLGGAEGRAGAWGWRGRIAGGDLLLREA